MSKEHNVTSDIEPPKYASDVPHVPMNFEDRDAIVGRLMEVIEAVMPEGRQQDATKALIKKSVSDHFISAFNTQYEILRRNSPTTGDMYDDYCRAIWAVAVSQMPKQDQSNEQ